MNLASSQTSWQVDQLGRGLSFAEYIESGLRRQVIALPCRRRPEAHLATLAVHEDSSKGHSRFFEAERVAKHGTHSLSLCEGASLLLHCTY